MTLKEQIENLIASDSKEIEILMTPIKEIEKVLTSLGYDELNLTGDELNGWQVDFWYKFTHEEKPNLTVSGSLYYGDFKIYKVE